MRLAMRRSSATTSPLLSEYRASGRASVHACGASRQFVSMGKYTLGGGHGEKGSLKPGIVIAEGGASAGTLKASGGEKQAHVLVEGKTPTGTEFQSQCGKYMIGFAVPGSRFTVILGLRGTTFRVLLFTAKAWAQIGKFDYARRDLETLKWLTFLLSDKVVDRSFERAVEAPMHLMAGTAVRDWYEEGSEPKGWKRSASRFVLTGQLGEPFFRSPAMFGSRTVVWSVRGNIVSAGGRVLEEGSFVLKHSFIRAGRVPNTHRFAQLVEENRPWAAAAGWFVESVGIWVDEALRRLGEKEGCRVGVCELTRGSPEETWAAVTHTRPVSDLLRAFRDGVRCIWALRPLHHRDISVYNLLLRVDELHAGEAEAARMGPVLEWTDETAAPRLTTVIMDYDRSRFGEEPSDLQRRTAYRALGEADPDMSMDDAITDTIPFMSRAQHLMMLADGTGQASGAAMAQVTKAMPAHRHWHDVESLCLCLVFAFLSRYERKSESLAQLLDSWFDESPMVATSQDRWLIGVMDLASGALLTRTSLSSIEEMDLVISFQTMIVKLQAVFPLVPTEDRIMKGKLTATGISIFGEVDSEFWHKALGVAFVGIEKFEALEAKQSLKDEQKAEAAVAKSENDERNGKGKRKPDEASLSSQGSEEGGGLRRRAHRPRLENANSGWSPSSDMEDEYW